MRRARRRASCARWASRSSATTPATCSRASAAAASARSCSAPTWTPCPPPRRSSPCSSTTAGRTRTTASSAPTTRPPSRCILEVARRCERRGLAGRPRAAVHRRRGGRAAGRQALRRVASCRLGVRLRVRPRDPDRRGRHRLADALPHRGRVPRQVRPRRPAPGVRPLGDPRRRPRRRARCRTAASTARRPPTSATCTAASSPPTSSPSARALLAEVRSLDPDKAEEALAGVIDALHDGASHGECDVDVITEKQVVGYRQKPVLAGRRRRRGRPARPRLRAAAASPPAARRTRTSSRPRASRASTWPTAPSTTTSPPSASPVYALESMLDITFTLLDEAAGA